MGWGRTTEKTDGKQDSLGNEAIAAEPTADQLFQRLKTELHRQVIGVMDLSAVGTMREDQVRVEVRRAAEELCRRSAHLLNLSEREQLVNEVIDETFGLGP